MSLAGSAIVSVFLIALSMGLSRLFLRRSPIEEFSASFCNAGFMGIPLIAMALGDGGIICIAPFVALLNILQWTYGQNLLLGKRQFSFKMLFLNPLVLALIAGVALYTLALMPPALLRKPIASLAACNAPIAMIILGYYLAELPLRQVFMKKSAWRVSLLRLVVIPLASVLCVAWLPFLKNEAKTALVIAASAPVGINVAVYAELLDCDYQEAVILICHSSILSMITMPLVLLLMQLLAG